MAHKHNHSHDEDGMFGHHEAAYNAEKIIRNLILLQEHYAEDPCADCISKHINTIVAYAQEGMTLDGAEEYTKEFDAVIELMNRHIKIVLECAVKNVCRIKDPKDMLKMIHEVRAMRRALNRKVYGLEGDVTHDILAGHSEDDDSEDSEEHDEDDEEEKEDIYTAQHE